MTLEDDPLQLFEGEAVSLHFTDLSLLYSLLGSSNSFHIVSFHGTLSWFSDSSNSVDGSVCFAVTKLKQKNQSLTSRHSVFIIALFRFSSCEQLASLIQSFHTGTSCLPPVFAYCQFSAQVLHWLHLVDHFGPGAYQIPQVHTGATEQICPCGSCPAILAPFRQFLDVVHFPVVYGGQSQLLGFGTSLNSAVAASTQHSVYLSIFQLPERTDCTASILIEHANSEPSPCGANYVAASTPQRVRATFYSKRFHDRNTTLGGDPTFGIQFLETFPDGKTHSIS